MLAFQHHDSVFGERAGLSDCEGRVPEGRANRGFSINIWKYLCHAGVHCVYSSCGIPLPQVATYVP